MKNKIDKCKIDKFVVHALEGRGRQRRPDGRTGKGMRREENSGKGGGGGQGQTRVAEKGEKEGE